MKLCLTILLLCFNLFAQNAYFNKHDADVWADTVRLTGKINPALVNAVIKVDNTEYPVTVNASDSSFSQLVNLSFDLNKIVITTNSFTSDTLRLISKFKNLPDVFAFLKINGSLISAADSIDSKGNTLISKEWIPDSDNPEALTISGTSINAPQLKGEYYLDLITIWNTGDTVRARTYFTVKDSSIKAFDIKNDFASWIDTAVIYEVTPYIFANGQTGKQFTAIKNKIPDFKRLGINTIWLQPVYGTYGGGQGYDITNYFSIRSDLGTEADLRNLIKAAKDNGMKVLFDFVANHTSINHPYAVNSSEYKTNSHYWNYYQREADNAPYSQHYHYYGGFINYFWDELPNLNFNNIEVQNFITSAAKYWIENFDIDGYRFDAIWGTTARNPEFTKHLRYELKKIKPEILMLGEDKASQAQVFDERFDAAYDWSDGYDWVSQWPFAAYYSSSTNPTIFNNATPNTRAQLLRNAITNNGKGYSPDAEILRFLDNNDMFYFITHHQPDRTKMAAALMYTLPGIPLVYNGQEIGKTGHPYNQEYLFFPGLPIDNDDPNKLFPFYSNLLKYKKILPSLYKNNYAEVTVLPNTFAFGFRRWYENENVFTILNMGNNSSQVSVSLPTNNLNLDTAKTYYLTDLISGNIISGKPSELAVLSLNMNKWSAQILYLDDAPYVLSIVDHNNSIDVPDQFTLYQNYPNPFNPSTIIMYSLPEDGNVELIIYDVLGREILKFANEYQQKGIHNINFDGKNLPSGMYIYKLNYKDNSFIKKMMLVK